MAIFEWRKFNFFDLKQGGDGGKIFEATKDANVTCGTSGRGQNIVCDSTGNIHVFYRNWEYITFKGHDSSIFLCALSTQNNLLVTISNENSAEVPTFKVWNLSKITKDTGAACLRTVKAVLEKPTSLAVTENGQFMAIGFDRGGISLYKGDIGRDRSKMKTLSSGNSAVTGIAFKQHGKTTHMFVCSDSGVLVFNLQNKDKEIKTILDKIYAPTRCCALQTYQGLSETHFMIGRDDAIYCYTLDGRGPCYALEGQKFIIQWFRSHLLTITKSTKNIGPSQKEYVLTVIDIQNKFIVYTSPIDKVIAILIEFGTCFILTKTKECYHLNEKDLQSKLYLLFKKNLYDIAIRIAKSQQYDQENLANIFKQYGDHLYTKGNYSGAIEQYIKTIGYLEPSYIIRRFLDSRHINYLTDYLQALHKNGKATSDHTTLLLNCFTRLDLSDKLKEFLSNSTNDKSNKFDLDIAIKVCRNTSIDIALELAKRNQKHEYCISILIEEKCDYEGALDYISELSAIDAEINLKKYGIILMENCPDRTTNLLKRLCTNYNSNTSESITIIENTINTESNHINAENFIQLFFKHPDKLIEFLEYLVMHINNCNETIYNTLIELYLKKWHEGNNTVENRLIDILKTYEDVYNKDHILVLCKMYDFWPGILWIYEDEKLYHLIVRYYLKNHDYENLLSTCKRLGASQPSLWLQALTGLRDDSQAPINLLLQVLNVIATEKLQSPLQILNCLAVEQGPKLCHVREYFLQVFQKEDEYINQESKNVEKLRNDLKSLKDHIENLRSNTIEFRSTICDTCHQPLTLPAVYFMCKHSFHQDCIRTYSENEKDCNVCHERNSQLTDALHAQNESRNQHQAFHNILDRSNDPFSIAAEYFGRGLFNKIVIVDEQENQEINQNIIEPATIQKLPLIEGKDYGLGAEAKLRLNEGRPKMNQLVVDLAPKSEGRLRLEESNKYSSSLKSTSSIKDSIRATTNTTITTKIIPNTRNSSSPKLSSSKAATISKAISKSTNPFDNEDDDGDEKMNDDYDDSKNPFAEDENTERNNSGTGGAKSNPFGEYDNNLNPFA